MRFGVYIHIPYCLQRCTYCDFATYEHTKILPPHEYAELLKCEIQAKSLAHLPRPLDTLYFGGGTPSLLKPELIVSIIHELEKYGFPIKKEAEVTIEINPATITEENLKIYLDHGINRFSVGAQSFDDKLLKSVNREHNAAQTRDTLDLLAKYNLNYTFDLLFALPHQSLEQLQIDLKIVSEYAPPHLSAYCLTVPEGHPLSKNRPLEDVQVQMFDLIEHELKKINLLKYEISNFARPGYESRHNNLYWTFADEYWGLGLSAHSYAHKSPWGVRYWNPNHIDIYAKQVLSYKNKTAQSVYDFLPNEQYELLKLNQAATDFCHISLRKNLGLSQDILQKNFPDLVASSILKELKQLQQEGLLEHKDFHWNLSEKGQLISNRVFERLTFLDDSLPH